jgi:hypothetical protein
MVNVLVNFLGVTHLAKQTTKDTDTAHPEYLEWQTSIGSTTTLTNTYRSIRKKQENRQSVRKCGHGDISTRLE